MTTTPTPTAGPSNLTARVVSEIKAEMGRQDVTRAELARRLNVSQMWVGDRLRRETQITLLDLDRIATALSVSVDRFWPPRSGGLPTGSTGGPSPRDPLAPRIVAVGGALGRANAPDRRKRRTKTRRRTPSVVAGLHDRPATRTPR